MPADRKHHKDPPASSEPRDHVPTTGTYDKRGIKRGAMAAVSFGAAGLIYALMPIAFAFGGAALGIWWVAADFRDWLDRRRVASADT